MFPYGNSGVMLCNKFFSIHWDAWYQWSIAWNWRPTVHHSFCHRTTHGGSNKKRVADWFLEECIYFIFMLKWRQLSLKINTFENIRETVENEVRILNLHLNNLDYWGTNKRRTQISINSKFQTKCGSSKAENDPY